MAGLNNIAEIVTAEEEGRSWITQFRKAVTSTATVTFGYLDYSYFAGSPLANFYASTPLESASLAANRGIYLPTVSPYKQFLKSVSAMSLASSAANLTNQRQTLILVDHLMYYPFIDTDSTEQQDMVQAIPLPRYESAKVLAIGQASCASIGQFTFTYTNQDGVAGQVSPNIFTQITNAGGQAVGAHVSAGGYHPYLPLAAGDSGVQSIESVTFTVAGGGLMALVLVHPLQTFPMSADCRRTTAGNLESYGACSTVDRVIHQAGMPEIKDGAILGFFGKGDAGSLSSSNLVGTIETIWS